MPVQGGGRFTTTSDEEALLVNGVSAGWKRIYKLHPFTVDVSGAASFTTVTVYVSNAPAMPTDADANHSVLGTKTAPGSILSDGPYNFVKVVGPAPVNAYLAAANNAPAR